MAIENGIYCQYCVDESGKLQDFATRFERMVAWQERRRARNHHLHGDDAGVERSPRGEGAIGEALTMERVRPRPPR
jgi:hypothetical protein